MIQIASNHQITRSLFLKHMVKNLAWFFLSTNTVYRMSLTKKEDQKLYEYLDQQNNDDNKR